MASENVVNNNNIDNIESTDITTKNDPLEGYKMIQEMIESMESQYLQMKRGVEYSIKREYHVGTKGFDLLLYIKKQDICNLSYDDVVGFFTNAKDDSYQNTDIIKYLLDTYQEDEESDLDTLRKCMTAIKTQYLQIMIIKNNCDEIKKEQQSIIDEYLTFMSSSKVRSAKKEQLEKMIEALSQCTDEHEKKRMEKLIRILKAEQTVSFIFNRIEVRGDNEIEAIKNAFFDEKKSKYVMNKYTTRIRQFGYQPNSYKFFLNLEETFLDEAYHVYNNLFLFVYMRFIAYADPYSTEDLQYVHALTSSIAELVYHRFNNIEDESYIKEVIMKMDNKFDRYYDYFKEFNMTQPNHPARKEVAAQKQVQIHNALVRKLTEIGVTDYDQGSSNEDLQKLLTETQNQLIQSQIEEEKKELETLNQTQTEPEEENEESNELSTMSE